ncbi:MAG TPA: ribbon-helix-helix protein, CopG family [Firmicutes bacterium]|nr:ribbon-helix-helix protein, CopG family [Bacillota bacterium]HHT43354.1 ribbon-helix-helix protein, CopG family [Bacillota bacterium]
MDTKRVNIRIPTALLAKIDNIAHAEKINRSQFIQNVVQLYIMEREAATLQDKLRVGYQIMGELNLTLAEEGNDEDLLEDYERQLAEAE